MKNYLNSKLKIFNLQKKNQFALINKKLKKFLKKKILSKLIIPKKKIIKKLKIKLKILFKF
jgi:UDP-N-acetylmuramoylalanine-D-glutamate ligase